MTKSINVDLDKLRATTFCADQWHCTDKVGSIIYVVISFR